MNYRENKKVRISLLYKLKCLMHYYICTNKGRFELKHYGKLLLILLGFIIVIEMVLWTWKNV